MGTHIDEMVRQKLVAWEQREKMRKAHEQLLKEIARRKALEQQNERAEEEACESFKQELRRLWVMLKSNIISPEQYSQKREAAMAKLNQAIVWNHAFDVDLRNKLLNL